VIAAAFDVQMEANGVRVQGSTRGREVDTTIAGAHLPGLDIEIVHRRLPDGEAEQISIHLQAVPSFEAFGRYLEAANPFAFWAQAARLAWLPWLAVARAVMPPNLAPPLPSAGADVVPRSAAASP
jgi:hypothetical protein